MTPTSFYLKHTHRSNLTPILIKPPSHIIQTTHPYHSNLIPISFKTPSRIVQTSNSYYSNLPYLSFKPPIHIIQTYPILFKPIQYYSNLSYIIQTYPISFKLQCHINEISLSYLNILAKIIDFESYDLIFAYIHCVLLQFYLGVA